MGSALTPVSVRSEMNLGQSGGVTENYLMWEKISTSGAEVL